MRSTTGQPTVPRRLGIDRPWALPPERVAADLGTDPVAGLPEGRRPAGWPGSAGTCWSSWLASPPGGCWPSSSPTVIVVLLVAAGVAAALGDLKDTVVILAILVLNGLLGFVQEYRAERAMAALKAMTAPVVRVRRGGGTQDRPAAELVPGDLVLLGPGDLVAADLRLTKSWALRVNEAALTGESTPATKQVEPLPEINDSLPAERRNMAFRGTAVTGGRGAGVVVATGMATELGRLAELLQRQPAEPTPLQRRLAVLGRRMAMAALVVCAVVFAVGVARGQPVERMFLTAVSLAVAAIPEGLPAVVTIALALGARRMAARQALVRKLPAVETLGSTTVICSDKTGTLTQNRMLVERVWTPAGSYRVTGDGYAPVGTVVPDSAQGLTRDPHLDRLARVAAACNDASLRPPAEAGGHWAETGDPTEAALLALAGKLGVDRDSLARDRPRVAEVAFDATRRRMTTLHQEPGGVWAAVKGAVDTLAPLVDPADAALGEEARAVAARWASDGYRILALADRRLPAVPDPPENAETDLRLLGLVAMADPPRTESAAAVAACRRADVTPVMITGDDARTAAAIAGRVGILDGGGVLTGAELARLDEEELAERVAGARVFARTSPEQKLRLIGAWKDRGAVVAMTGDGVNDAPALRQADIGVAMGMTGTDVAKEAADMVLADDNFATIVAAVQEGRRIYDNIRRFVRYLLTTNSGEIWVMFLASVLALPVPLLPVQILWINLVTDGLPAIALGLEPVERDAMRRPPRSPSESIFARGLWQHALWVGLTMAAVCLALLVGARAAGWPWQTMVFTTLALLQLGHVLAVRSERQSFFALGARSNLFLLGAVAGAVVIQLSILYLPGLQRPVPHPGAGTGRAGAGPGRLDRRLRRRGAREMGHPPKVPPFTCLMALIHRPRSEQATAGRVMCARHREVMTMTATMEEQTTLERLLGTVGEAMTRDVVLLAADMPAAMALRRLDEKAVSGAPVVERGRVVGVITRRDLLVPTLLGPAGSPAAGVAWHRNRLDGLRVGDLMSGEPVTAEPDWPLVRAVKMMIVHGVNRLPVVDQAGRSLGVLTRDDVLGAVVGAGSKDRQGQSPAREVQP